MADTSEPRSNLIIIMGIILAIIIFVVLIGLSQFYQYVRNRELYVKVETAQSEPLSRLREMEAGLIGGYVLLEGPGVDAVRIPIERAMTLEAESPWRRAMSTPAPLADEPATAGTEPPTTEPGEAPPEG